MIAPGPTESSPVTCSVVRSSGLMVISPKSAGHGDVTTGVHALWRPTADKRLTISAAGFPKRGSCSTDTSVPVAPSGSISSGWRSDGD